MNVEEIKRELKPYTTEITRVNNKKFAPAGCVFFVIKTRDKMYKYSSSLIVKSGYSEEEKEKLFEKMYEEISKKYNL